jgi:hypothetical protein
MAIGSVRQQGTSLYIFDERGAQLGMLFNVLSRPKDRLMGYTSSVITVKTGNSIVTYDQHGHPLSNNFSVD